MTVYVTPSRHWVCPHCTAESVTHEARPHSRFHACRGLFGITAPMVEEGVKVDVRTVEREDYIGSERVTLDAAGRPIMAVVSEREDGQDAAVFAGLATNGAP